MSNHLAIATVTATLQRLLAATVQADVPGAGATVHRPEPAAPWPPAGAGVNIYLHHVTPSAARRGDDLPTRDSAGRVQRRPGLPLDLHYILSFHGDEVQFEPQRVMGSVARTLHSQPILSGEMLEATTFAAPGLAEADLHRAPEPVRITPAPMTIEELSKLWTIFYQTSYMLSMRYVAMTVTIEADAPARRPLPVRARTIEVVPYRRARIDRAEPVAGPLEPVVPGTQLALHGSGLAGPGAEIRAGAARIAPDRIAGDRIDFTLAAPELRAGLIGLQVVYDDGTASNQLPLRLRPTVGVDQPNVTPASVPLVFDPPVGRDQPASLLLDEADPPAGRDAFVHRFPAPSQNGIADPFAAETAAIAFPVAGVAPGSYLVRAEVAGADSPLTAGLVDGEMRYVAPLVVMP